METIIQICVVTFWKYANLACYFPSLHPRLIQYICKITCVFSRYRSRKDVSRLLVNGQTTPLLGAEVWCNSYILVIDFDGFFSEKWYARQFTRTRITYRQYSQCTRFASISRRSVSLFILRICRFRLNVAFSIENRCIQLVKLCLSCPMVLPTSGHFYGVHNKNYLNNFFMNGY